MNDRYLFDKRVMKKYLTKYGLMFLGIFVILIFVNGLLPSSIDGSAMIFIDVAAALILLLVIEVVIGKIKKKKMEKVERRKMEKTSTESQDVVVVENVEVKKKNKQRK